MANENEKYINPYRLWVGAFIPNWLLSRAEVSQGAKLCYARLSQYAGKDGVCYPSQETIADELGVSVRMVRRYVDELKHLKLIKIRQHGLQQPNQYLFLEHPWMNFSPAHDVIAQPNLTPAVDTSSSCERKIKEKPKKPAPKGTSCERKKSTSDDYVNAHKIYEHWNSKKQETEDIIACTETFDGIKFRLKGAVNKRNADDVTKAIDNYVSAMKGGYRVRHSLIEFMYRIDKFMPQNFRASDFNNATTNPYSANPVRVNPVRVNRNPDIPYDKIIDYLNGKAGKQFSVNDNVCSAINAIWDKGYRGQHFQDVIDNMTAKWKNDPKMNMFLSPQTLFKVDKFETYLNAVPVKREAAEQIKKVDLCGRPVRYPKSTVINNYPVRR